MRIALIGSGNVATVLGRKLLAAGHTITRVFSKDPAHAHSLATELRSAAASQVSDIFYDAEMHIVAISDDSLLRIHTWGWTTTGTVVHTAGSVSKEVLRTISNRYGVLYPLQTLRKDFDTVNEVPFLIDGNTDDVKSQIAMLAASISNSVHSAGDDERKTLHLGAVIANNFSNHLFTLTERFCKNNGVDFNLLRPMILEGAMRLRNESPRALQTGPAMRGDQQTLAAHRAMLRNDPALLQLYDLFTQSISQSAS